METENEIIAEFMGLKSFEDSRYGTLWPSPLKAKTPATCFGLCYHESWDWLMPVVEKIRLILQDNAIYETAKPMWDVICIALSTVEIKAVHITVTQFIKWYNTQPKI